MAEINLEKKISKSKKWIDYSSQQENDHDQDQKNTHDNHKHQSHKQQTLKQQTTKNDQKSNLPVLSTSHQPVKEHLLQDRKQQLQRLRNLRYNHVWMEFKVQDEKDFPYLKQKIQQLRKQKNNQILNIYPSKDYELTFDIKADVQLCQKWLTSTFDPKNIIKVELSRKISATNRKDFKSPNYDNKNRDYKPVKQYYPQHTTSTKYQPKYQQKQKYQPREQRDNHKEYQQNKQQTKKYHSKYQQKGQKFIEKYEQKEKQQPAQKKKYIQKNPIVEKIEQKVEEQLAQKKQQKKQKQIVQNKQKPKDKNPKSKFYSKNPFEEFN